MSTLAGWGNYPKIQTELANPRAFGGVQDLLGTRSALIARGNGRAYGDAAIGEKLSVSTLGLNRMRAFDPDSGRLTVEAGVLIADILKVFVPRGFFLKVVPGTKFVSVGGAIAADVHGKNHHRDGGFGNTLESLRLALPNGETAVCSLSENPELFRATVGGMGLTGIILEATIFLHPIETGWLRQETTVAANLEAAIAALDSGFSATYSVAWIDCLARGASLGRSLIYCADHAKRSDIPANWTQFASVGPSQTSVPDIVPSWVLNRSSVTAFNELYFRRGAAREGKPSLVHWNPYFFPLDAVANWNRIYGRQGFVQHQCVIPADRARAVLSEILDRVSRRGSASFLAVLKQLGESDGAISFPLRGYTLAMDFAITNTLFAFLDEIDALVRNAGGRIYLAKDARQSRETFEAGYPGISLLRDVRRQTGGDKRLASRLSTRLGI
jgi:decaprenylphospho-beta-D-ribofuranose 2-oxidase